MELTLFVQISLVLAIAAGVSAILKLLRQPLILGYILTGIVVGPSVFNLLQNHQAFESFSQIGIALLLFIVGLGLNVGAIRSLGKPVLIVTVVKTLIIGSASYIAAQLLGMSATDSLIIATGSLFCSTIIVIKALSDKRALTRLYGSLTVGLALIEDVLATIALLAVTAAKNGGGLADIEMLLMKGIGLALGMIIISVFVLPKLSKFFASSQEFLFMFALMWALGIATLFQTAGFSLEIGALFAGVSLASLPYAAEISSRLKPLRDFFLVLFFVSLGERLSLGGIADALVPALVLSFIIVIIKTIVISGSLERLGYTAQTSYQAAVHMSQISEFSVILGVLAVSTGLASDNVVSILTLTALITFAISTTWMHYDSRIFNALERILKLIERPNPVLEPHRHAGYKLILFGYHKGGHEFIKTFREMRKRYIVVDYNPEVIEVMERQHINHIFGDATDLELLDEIGIHKAEMVVSTITDIETNLLLSRQVNQWNPDGLFVCHAVSYDDAAKLYEHGAAYVMLPHLVGSEHMNSFLRRHGSDRSAIEKYRKRNIVNLGKMAIS